MKTFFKDAPKFFKEFFKITKRNKTKIKVEISDVPEYDGMFIEPYLGEKASIIFFSTPNLIKNWDNLAITWAHELGHNSSYLNNHWNDSLVNCIAKLMGSNPCKITKKEYKSYMDEEQRAWDYARELLTKIQPRLIPELDSQEKECTKIYKNKFKQLM